MNRTRSRLQALATGTLLALLVACSTQSPQPTSSSTVSAPAPSRAGESSRAEAPPRERERAPQAAVKATPDEAEEVVVTGSRLLQDSAHASTATAPLPAQQIVQAGIAPVADTATFTGPEMSAGRTAPFADTEAAPRGRPVGIVHPGEELWIIATPSTSSAAGQPAHDDSPGSGTLLASFPADADEHAAEELPLPLKHTSVVAQIRGYVGTVDVVQQFENPYNEKIEAVYLFPLPEKAAVREFVMTVGERRIRGILREKREAEQIYQDARAQGYQASLLVQHRPNVFEQKVANIEPGRQIDIEIRYFHTLAWHDGWYTWSFPTVVGPRYNPVGLGDPIGAEPHGARPRQAAPTAVQYLRPSQRSAHDISIAVDLDAGVPIEELESTHPIVATLGRHRQTADVRLAAASTIPNRDFVLRFKVAGDTIRSNLLTYTDPATGEGYFTLMVYPPADLAQAERQPVELVFVVDTSGSMAGRPMEQAKAAMLEALDRLEPDDTFQIVRFASHSSTFGSRPVPATDENLRHARRYVASLDASGGTEMLAGLRASLSFPHDPRRLRFVTFMTDGYIGNDREVIGEVSRLLGDARIFSFGVGNSVNRYLLERMASEGRGAVAYLGLEDSAADIMRFFFERISRPALTDIEIDWGRMNARDVYPARTPDLFVGRPAFITGRFDGRPGAVTLLGRAAGETQRVHIAAPPDAPGQEFIASLWARQRIADLSDRRLRNADPYGEFARAIRDTALGYGLMSDYTAFIAVDATERTDGAHGTTVYQPVPVPDGVRYDTTVGPSRE